MAVESAEHRNGRLENVREMNVKVDILKHVQKQRSKINSNALMQLRLAPTMHSIN